MATVPRQFIGQRLKVDIVDKFSQAVRGGVRGATNSVVAAAVAFNNLKGNEAEMLDMHRQVANSMRRAMLTSFGQTVTANKTFGGRFYRVGQNRYSGGTLKRALQDPGMAVATARGISYVNQTKLNAEARHWQRLNFGALGTEVHNRPARQFRFLFDDVTVFTLRFRAGPRPAFFLPVGMFITPEGTRVGRSSARTGLDMFQPTKKQVAVFPTRGIEARNFLDAGLAPLAVELPAMYLQKFHAWFRQGNKAGLEYAKQVRVLRPERGGVKAVSNFRT